MVLTLSFSDAAARLTGVLCLLGGVVFGACASSPETATSSFLVPRLAPGITINVLDNSLEEWPAGTEVWVLDSSSRERATQVDNLRGRAPADFSSADARVRVLMAHNREHWFLGFHVVDDRFVLSTQPEHPYGGDCVELFFAGEELDSMAPISDIITSRDAALKPAFFQLNLQPSGTPPLRSAFSTYRTEPALIRVATSDPAFALSASRTSDREWIAELRLPFAFMSDAVQAAIRDGRALRIAFDYLDYDGDPAPLHHVAPFYAFRPDNLLAPTRVESQLHTPGLMPAVVFER